ncbi:hypothetical protein C0J52_03206 [Blattella germanica]|nr:hypothetical protein C0J52_03206 [Blattella germanica]
MVAISAYYWCLWYHVWVDVVSGVDGAVVAAVGEEEILEEDPVMMSPVLKENQLDLVTLHLNTVAAHLSTMLHHLIQR